MAVNLTVGCILGFLSGLGIGGGSLLMLWLTLIVQLDSFTARCINLMVFIPCALCASFFRWRQGTLKVKKILLPMALGCAAAAGFSILGQYLDDEILKKLFGFLLIAAGIRELFFSRKGFRPASRN